MATRKSTTSQVEAASWKGHVLDTAHGFNVGVEKSAKTVEGMKTDGQGRVKAAEAAREIRRNFV